MMSFFIPFKGQGNNMKGVVTHLRIFFRRITEIAITVTAETGWLLYIFTVNSFYFQCKTGFFFLPSF